MKKLLFILTLCFSIVASYAQEVKATWRLDYYMNETQGEFLVHLPNDTSYSGSKLSLTSPTGKTYTMNLTAGRTNSLIVPIDDLSDGSHVFTYSITTTGDVIKGNETLIRRPYKFNATQLDRKTAGVISRGMPIIPFGFYCYSPVQSTIAEEEVVQGFNLLSPYQNIPRTKIEMRKVYMDRAAELGMKVNYNLLSVATGGTGYNSKQDAGERIEMLKREVRTFKDHPALLSWYLADEPDGRKTDPAIIEQLYDIIKEIDPYHPVTIVFMHKGTARKYAEGLDIAMGDLYPVPRNPISGVSEFQRLLRDEFICEKGIWLVPQAFGGNEWWKREPTAAEMRAATYMGLINGSTGFQYFIRHGQNGFPKSTTAWAEAGAMALEIAEMTPYILSGEDAPQAFTQDTLTEARAWARGKNLIIAAVNQENRPKDIVISLKDYGYTGVVSVPFEDREVRMVNGIIMDKMGGFDSKVYKITLDSTLIATPDTANVVVDGDFEINTSVGVPNGVYAQVGDGRGSTYFVDSRTAHSGEHSLRLITYANGKGVTLQHFPMIVPAGKTYRVSFWAKAGDTREFPLSKNYVDKNDKVKVQKIKPEVPTLSLNLRHLGRYLVNTDVVIDSPQWKQYTIDVVVEKQPGQGRDGITLNICLKNRGMIWIDDIRFTPVEK